MKKLLVIAALLSLTACSKVSIENYEKISVGMEKAELEKVLGSADSCEEKTLHTNCVWGNESKNITVTLVSDRVTLFSKKGL
ncbi:DUF3862 domain-containing protein [Pseudoalteromonas luteoviolacea]|uniref:Lipoprotein n=1 Tax=Pseudoalteromonas luteoviolacea H33 TaxID=1365251 RepID=A0A167GJN4_9GAMM|nr:hypothetical protein [Pseudoalteromonas luteoviolacea]KZN55523.1 hypothetical protein N476_07275 [Pseudoalteromonas luteoviolacea H33]KZN74458.1 hypothetical protein N477_22025 [Pseudoalteromonas luteoviolacea H33-S]MBQ4879810.1 DUF3862 domain-containing protein [Pseudoalteromonas luteoviolacea]MBQ4908886.1 DUF3862 domain-containing protein [Pseudoalteromonas luteoviolacea]MCF6442455.1 DUF3862 domain-containing protein [Pseudoalteromonas luteoviolacea]